VGAVGMGRGKDRAGVSKAGLEAPPTDKQNAPPTNIDKNASPLRRRVGVEVRVLRVMHGWTQEVLAEVAGLHRNYVGYVERGERNVGIDNLEQLANALGVPIAVLLRVT